MRKTLAVGNFFCSALLALLLQTQSMALVPGPILLSDEQLEQMQQDNQRQLVLSTTRAKAGCLMVANTRFCPGIPMVNAQELHRQLPAAAQKRTLLFNDGPLFKGVLALLPAAIKLPPAKLGAAPTELKSELAKTLMARIPGVPTRQAFAKTFAFKADLKGLNSDDLAVWYYAESHLGLLTHNSEEGEFVIGAFVVK